RHPLGNEPLIIGRSPDKCRVVLPANAVSRERAAITPAGGQYFVEDLQSRNKTYVNNKQVDGRWPNPLKNGDNIKICDFLFAFQDESGKNRGIPADEEEETSNTTVEATFNRASPKDFLVVQPQEKLRALLDITTALTKTLNVEALLPQIADELFKVFKQADRCFIIQLDEDHRLRPVVTKVRRHAAGNERFSRTIVRRALETLQSYLSEDATSDSDVSAPQSIAALKMRFATCVPPASH